MRIQHNIMAMNAYRNYNTNTSALSKNLEKLSSGYKINRAGDDAAGLAISEKMRAQITGLETAQKNAKDGISLVQTAEGALTEVHDMLNRMVELATQSSNGTFDSTTDRAQLQKEIVDLKAEIDRIADSANFNGISLLDGSLAEATGVDLGDFTSDEIAAIFSGPLGTQGTADVDGVLKAGTEEVSYSTKIYFAEFTNSDAAGKKITINYKDNTGTAQTIELTVGGGKKATIADVVAALSTGTSAGDITVSDSGTAFAGDGTKGGLFKELYNVSVDGGIITITAKSSGEVTTGSKDIIDGSKLGTVSMDLSDITPSDLTAANKKLQEDYGNTGTANDIAVGSKAGQDTTHVAATDGQYQVASTAVTLDSSKTGEDFHNMGFTVGDITYIIKSGTKELKNVPEDGDTTADGKTVKYIEVEDGDTHTDIADKIAQQITRDEPNNGGYVATATGGVLTISESTNRGEKILNEEPDYVPGIGKDLIQFDRYELAAASGTITGTITLDSSKLVNGTTITIGDKSYMLTNDPEMSSKGGATKIVYGKNATSEDIAKALADQMTKDGITNVTTDGKGGLVFTDSEISGTGVSAVGSGLRLQIGDTSDAFNQLNVVIEDTHTDSLGIAGIDISTQTGAKESIDQIKGAINYVSNVRGTLGATQNRLDHTINNLSVMTENIQDAESTIRDTDVADEMMAYTKNNILIQSAQAMLAQANQVPQGVLQLLQ